MTDAEQAPNFVLDLPLTALAKVVLICAPHAEKPPSFGPFGCIHFFVRAGQLYAFATDRYTMAVHGTGVDADAGVQFSLTVSQAKFILAAFRAGKGSSPLLNLRSESGALKLSLAGGALSEVMDVRMAIEQTTFETQPQKSQIAVIEKFFKEEEAPEGHFMLDPARLSKLPKLRGFNGCVVRHSQGMVGVIGTDWMVIFAKYRGVEEDFIKPWRTVFGM